jgi:hypothetical protein
VSVVDYGLALRELKAEKERPLNLMVVGMTSHNGKRRTRLSSRATGVIVVVATVYWWAVFLSMHIVEPEFSPIEAPGSAYVLGQYGAWMTTTFFVLAAALLSSRRGLTTNLAVTVLTRLGGLAFLIATAGVVLAGIFPMDFPPPPRTLPGRLHALAGVVTFVPWVIGTLLFSLSIRRDQQWVRLSGTLFTISVISIGMAAVLPLSIRLGFAGGVQRLLLTLLFTWLIVVAVHLMHARLARNESTAEPHPLGPKRSQQEKRACP